MQLHLISLLVSLASGPAFEWADPWQTRDPMLEPKALHCMATGGDGRIYAVGGAANDGRPVTAAVFAYDVDRDAWRTAAPLTAGPRRNLACASDANGLVYAIGGYDFGNPPVPLARVERYDPQIDSWALLPDMPTARQGAAAVLGSDGRIYVMGGTDASFQTLATLEILDPGTEVWTAASPMTAPRTNFVAVAGRDGLIYAFGGYSEQDRASLNTAEVYDPKSDRWTPIASMNEARFSFAAVACPGGRIYAIGGDSSGSSVETYNPANGNWSYEAPMLVPRSGHAAALASDGKTLMVSGGDFLATSEARECQASDTATPPR